MKKIVSTLTALSTASILLASPLVASAQTVTGAQHANQASRLAKLHEECDTQIANRLTSLNTALTRINSLVKLSSDQKTKYAGEVTTDVNGLTSLKTKCDADVDLPTLRSDYRSVFTTYRVYAEFLPQLHLLIASDTMGVTTDKLSDLAAKLQSRLQSAGNSSNLTSLLSDMQSKIADAKTQYSNVESQVTPLTPNSYNSNPTGTTATLQNARSEIKSGTADLKAAWSDAKQIVQAFKALRTTPTPTP